MVGIDGIGGSYETVGNLSLTDRIGRRNQGITEAYQDASSSKIFSGGGQVSYRGPGLNNFINLSGNKLRCSKFEIVDSYRTATTFEKVYPICGTKGYFSIRQVSSPALYLIANSPDKLIFGDVSAMVDVQDSACWTIDTTGADEAGAGMLINKRFPGLPLTVIDENTIKLQQAGGDDKTRYMIVEERGLSTFSGVPQPRPAKFTDFEVRNGWDLADMNRSFGPVQFRSYELAPSAARSVEACAAEAAKRPAANGFVFSPEGSYNGMNCRIKAGGYWPELTGTTAALSRLVSGKLKGDAAGIYQGPIESFDVRKGWNVNDANISYGSNPSYELAQTFAPTPEACAASALQNPKANSFIFVPGAAKNCRLKSGGFWGDMEKPDPNWATLISGIIRNKAADSFDIRKGMNVADMNRSYGPNPSYELEPVNAYSADNCAQLALANPKANGFIYAPARLYNGKGNCKLKVGGFWPAGQDPNWGPLTGGIKK